MKSRADPLLRAIRSPATPTLVRKALVAANYTTRGGVYSDFTAAVRRYLPFFANGFRPDVVWGTFGNTDSWLIAQAIARSARCPWVADMKDPWDVFIPTALRCTLALRFTDMRAATCNSEMNADQLDRWFSVKPTVIYSGVDPSFFRPQQHMKADPHFRLTLTGSVHDEAVLERFVDALQQWLLESGAVASRGERTVEIVYAGADRMKVEPILGRLSRSAEVRTFGYLPLQELAGLCASAHANSYIWNPRTFHHKLLELLCCGRPVIAFPGETDESLCLARVSHGALFTCANSSELSDALTAIASTEPSQPRTLDPANLFSWDAQALKLEAFFRNLIPE